MGNEDTDVKTEHEHEVSELLGVMNRNEQKCWDHRFHFVGAFELLQFFFFLVRCWRTPLSRLLLVWIKTYSVLTLLRINEWNRNFLLCYRRVFNVLREIWNYMSSLAVQRMAERNIKEPAAIVIPKVWINNRTHCAISFQRWFGMEKNPLRYCYRPTPFAIIFKFYFSSFLNFKRFSYLMC